LRSFIRNQRLRLGICWLKTHNRNEGHGAKIGYLSQPEKWRAFDPELFDALCDWKSNAHARSLNLADRPGILKGAIFFNDVVPSDYKKRTSYFLACQSALKECDLIFFDPDNGFETKNGCRPSESVKYLYWNELRPFWDAGQSIITFQYFRYPYDRKNTAFRLQQLAQITGSSSIFALLVNHVSYLIAIQPVHSETLIKKANELVKEWAPIIRLNLADRTLPIQESS